MPISPMSFPVLSPEQAAPNVFGMQRGADLFKSMTQNAFLPQTLSEELKAKQIQNVIDQVKAQYAPQMTQAELSYKQAQTPNIQAQTSLLGEQAKYFGPEALSKIGLQKAETALTGEQAKNYGPNIQSEIGLRNAQTAHQQFLNNNPLLSMPGLPGQYGAVMYLKNHPELNVNPGNGPVAPQTNGSPASLPLGPGQVNNLTKNISSGMPGTNLTMSNPEINQLKTVPNLLGNSPLMGNPIGNPSDSLFDSIQKQTAAHLAQGQLALTRSQGYNFSQMPVDMRNYTLAQATAFGYDPMQASGHLLAGNTLQDLAKNKGYDEDPASWPNPVYAATGATRNTIQRRNSALSELNVLDKQILEATAPYAQRFYGWSPTQVKDAVGVLSSSQPKDFANQISNYKEEEQAKFLAARMITPEYNALRIKMMQGDVGIEALRHVGENSLNQFKTFESLLTPSVYKKANEYANQWLKDAVGAANNSVERPLQGSGAKNVISGPMVRVQKPDGSIISLPREGAQKLLKDFPDHKVAGG